MTETVEISRDTLKVLTNETAESLDAIIGDEFETEHIEDALEEAQEVLY